MQYKFSIYLKCKIKNIIHIKTHVKRKSNFLKMKKYLLPIRNNKMKDNFVLYIYYLFIIQSFYGQANFPM